MKRIILGVGVALMGLLLVAGLVSGEIPHLMNFQGRLTDDAGNPIHEPAGKSIIFSIWTDPNVGVGQELWRETQSVPVLNGIFNATLGSATTGGIPSTVFRGENASERWLQIQVVGEPQPMSPRQRITSVGYAFKAGDAHWAETIAANSVTSDKIVDGAIKAEDIGVEQVTSAQLTNNAVTAAKTNIVGIDSTTGKITAINATNFSSLDGSQLTNLPSDDDWTISGDDVYRTTGNVGIGTATPQYKLHATGASTGWLCRFINTTGNGNVYMNHGGGYGMHIRNDNATASTYLFNLYNANAGGHLLWVSGTGNVGIGTTSPGQKLHVNGNIRVDGRHLYLGSAQDLYGDNSSALYWDSNHDTVTQMIFRDRQNTQYGRIYGSGNGANFGLLDGDGNWSYFAAKDNYTEFRINNSTKMRIKSNGNVGIGTTAPGAKLDVVGNIRLSGGSRRITVPVVDRWPGLTIATSLTLETGSSYVGDGNIYISPGYNGYLDTYWSVILNKDGGNVGIGTTSPSYRLELPNIASTKGRGRANSWRTYSSIRWKKNIKPIEGALEKVGRLRGVSFDWKEDGSHDIGMVAEEVGRVIPEVVGYEENGKDAKSLDYGRLVAVLVEAVKEQQQKISALEKEIKKLKK